jgi:hypothetical protein
MFMLYRSVPSSGRLWKWFAASAVLLFQLGPCANLQSPPETTELFLGVAVARGAKTGVGGEGEADRNSNGTPNVEDGCDTDSTPDPCEIDCDAEKGLSCFGGRHPGRGQQPIHKDVPGQHAGVLRDTLR